jgi:hypothetical protein
MRCVASDVFDGSQRLVIVRADAPRRVEPGETEGLGASVLLAETAALLRDSASALYGPLVR